MHKILQNHLLCAFVANLKIDVIYALYPESFCDKNLAIRKVFAFCDSEYLYISCLVRSMFELGFSCQNIKTSFKDSRGVRKPSIYAKAAKSESIKDKDIIAKVCNQTHIL